MSTPIWKCIYVTDHGMENWVRIDLLISLVVTPNRTAWSIWGKSIAGDHISIADGLTVEQATKAMHELTGRKLPGGDD